ncbi:MAG: DMT family transporter [Chloroflexota bacterium]
MPGTASSRAFLLVLITGILWGTIGVGAKLIYETTTLDSVSVTWLRSLVAAAACIALAGPGLGRGIRAASRRDLALMAGLGVLLIVYQWCYLAAIDRLGIAPATLIALCVPPVLVAAVSVLFLGERMTPLLLACLLGALAGTALLVGAPAGGGEARDGDVLLAGVLFGLGSAVGVAAHALGSRRIAGAHDALLPLAIGFPAGTAIFAPAAFGHGFSWDQPAIGWALVIYLGVVPSALAYLLYQRGLRHLPASTATIITLVEPLTAAVLAWALFGERLGPAGLAGGGLLLASIVGLSRRAGDGQAAPAAAVALGERG